MLKQRMANMHVQFSSSFVRRGSSSETGVQTQLARGRAHEQSSTDLTAEGLKDLKDYARAKGGRGPKREGKPRRVLWFIG